MTPPTDALQTMARLVREDVDGLLARWRLQVRELPAARHLDIPSLNDHIPCLLDELATALVCGAAPTIPEGLAEASAPAHGRQRLRDGFDIVEVVAEYNILRGCLHDLATEHGVALQGRPFHVLNRVFDQAIGQALQTYADQRALELQRRRDEYLAFVVHDLRTPLAAISLAGRVLERALAPPAGPDDSVQRMLRSLRRNAQQLEVLVLKVLDENSQVQAEGGVDPVRRHFDLWPLMETLLEDLQAMAGAARCRLLNQVPDDLVLHADAALVRRVFQNLIGNAIKFAPGGEIRIGAQARAAQGQVDCWVSDDGAGIAPELLPRVFDKGESGDPGGGNGLGLAIVKAFVEAHGGSVGVDSRPGQGASFRFTLPLQPDGG